MGDVCINAVCCLIINYLIRIVMCLVELLIMGLKLYEYLHL